MLPPEEVTEEQIEGENSQVSHLDFYQVTEISAL